MRFSKKGIDDAGGIPRRNAVLNQVYANVLGKPVLVPEGEVPSVGSAIFAFLAAGAFGSIEDAQDALCPGYVTVEPDAPSARICQELYPLYRRLYFAFGRKDAQPVAAGDVLPALRDLAARVRRT